MACSSRSWHSIGSGPVLIGSRLLLLLLLLLSSLATGLPEWEWILEPLDHGLPLSVVLLHALGMSDLGIPERNSHGADLLVLLEQLLSSI